MIETYEQHIERLAQEVQVKPQLGRGVVWADVVADIEANIPVNQERRSRA